MPEEWYRSLDWDDAARTDFETRLRRARPASRPQYLRIKGLALEAAGEPDGARELWLRVVGDVPVDTQGWSAVEHLGDLACRQGHADEAERHYRFLLDRHPTLNGTTHMVEVSLAELLIERDDDASRLEALDLLRSALGRHLMLDSQQFRLNVALAAVSVQLGDVEAWQRTARTALNLADRGPQLPRHPTVGLVTTDNDTLRWLHTVATTDDVSQLDIRPPWQRRP